MEDWMYAVIIVAAILIIAFVLVGCFLVGDEPPAEEPVIYEVTQERLICTQEEFDVLMNDRKNYGTLLKYDAPRSSVSELTKGEKYYFVYGFRLYDKSAEMDKRAIKNIFEFAIEGLDGVYFGASAVSFGSMSFGEGVIDASFGLKSGELEIVYNGTDRVIDTYIAIEFIPEHTGLLRIESLVYGDEYSNAEFVHDKAPDTVVHANVTEKDMLGSDGEEINVTDISCGLLISDVYSDSASGVNSSGPISGMVSGTNYVIVDFSIESVQDIVTGKICFGLYVYGDGADTVRVEKAYTGECIAKPYGGGVLVNLIHDVSIKGNKRIRAVLEFENAEFSCMKMDLFVYGADTAVSGTAYKLIELRGEGIAELSFTADSSMTCFVSGCVDGDGKSVVIPDRHNGMPVKEISKDVFTDSSIKRLKTGKYIKKIEAESFRNCAYLEEVTLGNVSVIEERAFASCEALHTVRFSAALDRIYANAFNGCTSFTEAYFSEKNGWVAADTEGNRSASLRFENASEAGEYIADTYSSCYLYRSDILNLTDFKIYFAEAGTDTEGELPFKSMCPYIPGEWNETISETVNGTCLMVIDFAINTVFSKEYEGAREWSVCAETTWGSRISFIHATEETFEHIETGGDSDCNVVFSLKGDEEESSNIRIVYEFIPYHNGNHDTVDFTVNITGEETEYEIVWTVALNLQK